MKKGFLLAICLSLAICMTAAPVCSPPVTKETKEFSFKRTNVAVVDYINVTAVADITFIPCVNPVVLFNTSIAIPISRLGFVYRNIDYDNYKQFVDNPLTIVDKNV